MTEQQEPEPVDPPNEDASAPDEADLPATPEEGEDQ